ncbi:melanocortin-2 receptor accessory protein 2A [Acanthochromis polyacanthus]|uniref:Melanocortin 2 receptor accessory protein 2b n=1 Tax=Acanthochromis polyacanthus TaxID=80966 RepID=A0A3Q1HJG6_9TELE|nr:melanocortin-2 receptor accessory protein 2A [Acanthochromis polyacanthus]
MSDSHNRSQASARRSDYVWQYEYYDEEPVSFEGLRAHRYSIVIGFWVGLAVFVIFMFFVLTLLTKTGAPHQENQDSAEKHHRPGSCLVDIDGHQDENDKAFSRPLLAGSRSYFNFFISEDDQGQAKQKTEDKRTGKHNGARAQQGNSDRPRGISSSGVDEMEEDIEEAGGCQHLNGLIGEGKIDRECAFLSHFNIPNFVSLDHNSTLGEDDLLYEPSAILERQSRDSHCDVH